MFHTALESPSSLDGSRKHTTPGTGGPAKKRIEREDAMTFFKLGNPVETSGAKLERNYGERNATRYRHAMARDGALAVSGNSCGQREDRILLILALVVGALTGLAVVAFILLTERLGMRLYPVESAAWRRVLIPMAGSLGMGYLLWRYFPDARGSGVPQTKAAMFARDGVITLKTLLGKFFCTATTLACGIPLGREGPSVQVGGGIASVLGRRLGLKPASVRALIPIGAAAAIAAAFNTPLAAVLFSLEEIMGDLNAPVLGSVVLASATSWLVLRLLLGNNPLFQVPQYQLVHSAEFALYAVLGVAGGLVSVAFTKLLLATRKYFLQLPRRTAWFQPLAGGVVTGADGVEGAASAGGRLRLRGRRAERPHGVEAHGHPAGV